MRLRFLIARVFVTLAYFHTQIVARIYPEAFEQNRPIPPLWPLWRGDED
jgi:hypothetical protein